MSDETAVRQGDRTAIGAGTLPSRRPSRIGRAKGHGASCSICRDPVRPDEVGLELEFSGDRAAGNAHVHQRCFYLLELERHEESAETAPK